MGLNVAKGDMYSWLTHTWNTVKGECPHGCTYCYMRRWGKQKPVRLDLPELKTDLGDGHFIFVGSSCDLFAEAIPSSWIEKTLAHCDAFDNAYLFQSKNPARMKAEGLASLDEARACTTIETNRWLPEIMRESPRPEARAEGMAALEGLTRYVTIEPIMSFDLGPLVELVMRCEPIQVNIGADSGGNRLPEPSRREVLELIDALHPFTRVDLKPNLKRILG